MIAPRWRKLLRDAGQHRLRTALVVLAMAAGLAGAGVLLFSWALVQRVTAQTFLASHPVSASLRVYAVDAALLAQVRALPAVAAARLRRVTSASVETDGRWLRAQLFTLQEWQAQDIARLRPEQGQWPPRDGEIVLEASALGFSGAQPGGHVTLRIGEHRTSLPLAGIARDVSLPPGWMDHVVYAYVTPATLAQLGAAPAWNELQFVLRDRNASRDTARRIAYAVKALAEQAGGQVSHIEVPVPGEHAHAAQMDSLALTQGIFALVTLLACAFLVTNLVSGMLAAQTREIGILRAIGATPRQIGALYRVFAASLGLAAAALALPAALLAARPYAALRLDMLNFPLDATATPAWSIALLLAAACLLPLAAAALPVRRACRLQAAAALRDCGLAETVPARRWRLPGLGAPLQLAVDNALRKRQRLLLTVLALAAGGAVFLGAASLRSGVRESVAQLFAGHDYQLTLRLANRADAAQAEAIAAAVAGVQAVQALAREPAALRHADGLDGDGFSLAGLAPSSPLLRPAVLQGRWLQAGDGNAMVVSRSLLRDEPALLPGATANLRVDGKLARWTVVGIVDAGPQRTAYVTAAALAAARGDARVDSLLLQLAAQDAAAQRTTVLRLRAALDAAGLPVASSELLSETRRVFEDHLLLVVQFLGLMAWLMMAVGALGLASTMSLGVLERTREIGMLRAIGASDRAIRRLVQAEGLVVAALAWLAACVLSVPLSQGLAFAFGRIMFAVPVQLLPGACSALVWAVLLAAVSLLACAWPAYRAVKLPVAKVLAYA